MSTMILSLESDGSFTQSLAAHLTVPVGQVSTRSFPDGETFLQIESDLQGADIIVVESLANPNSKILPLLFLAKTARALGAKRVGLSAPYLAYMRQDKSFHPGEAVTSDYFAELLSQYFDWLITMDPHLHRHHFLSEIYSIPTKVVHAAPLLSSWIQKHCTHPFIIGPDEESVQWVKEVASAAGAPYTVLSKTRLGDNDVSVSAPDLSAYQGCNPILVDDIVSSAHTLIESQNLLKKLQFSPATAVCVHPVFAEGAYQALLASGVRDVITCNTIPHITNQIDTALSFATAIREFINPH